MKKGKGAVIITSIKGKVEVVEQTFKDSASSIKRLAEVGEYFGEGAVLFTDEAAEAKLLLTNGSSVKMGPKAKLKISAFWQKEIVGANKKISELTKETSPARVAFDLELGNLVIDVKKLNKESSLVITSNGGSLGVRGTQFKLSSDEGNTELSVVEGAVAFLDSQQKIASLTKGRKISSGKKRATSLRILQGGERTSIQKEIAQAKLASAAYDVSQVSRIQETYSSKKVYWYQNGQKMYERHYKDGKRDGLQMKWYENGQKSYEYTRKDGNAIGLGITWHQNGQKRYEVNYKNGKRDGLEKGWYSDGKKSSERTFKDGNAIGLGIRWYENGQKLYEKTNKDGKPLTIVVWKPNGDKCPVTNLKNGNGVWVLYKEDGTERSRHTYKDGELVKD